MKTTVQWHGPLNIETWNVFDTLLMNVPCLLKSQNWSL